MIVILPYESYMQHVDYDDGNENDSDDSEDDDATNATPGAPPHMNHVVRVEQTELLLTGTQTLDPEKFTQFNIKFMGCTGGGEIIRI